MEKSRPIPAERRLKENRIFAAPERHPARTSGRRDVKRISGLQIDQRVIMISFFRVA